MDSHYNRFRSLRPTLEYEKVVFTTIHSASEEMKRTSKKINNLKREMVFIQAPLGPYPYQIGKGQLGSNITDTFYYLSIHISITKIGISHTSRAPKQEGAGTVGLSPILGTQKAHKRDLKMH